MSKYLALTKALLKSGQGINFGGRQKAAGTKKAFNSKVLVVFVGILMIPLIFSLVSLGSSLYSAFSSLQLEILALQMICYACAFMVLALAIPYVLSTFFLSSDLENLLPLPLKPYQLVGAKFTTILVYEYLLVFLLLLPVFIGYGISASVGIGFWITLVIVILLLPIVPLIYASLLAMVMMHLFKNIKNKEAIITVGSLLMVVGVVMLNVFIQNNSDMDQLTSIALAIQPVIDKMNYLFPNVGFAASAMSGNGFLPLLAFIGISALYLVVFLLIANRIYLGGVMGAKESTGKKRKMTSQERDGLSRQGSPLNSYVKKELRLLIRTPIYLLNCVLTPFLMLIIVSIPILLSSSSQKSIGLLMQLVGEMPSTILEGTLLLGAFAIAVMTGSTNLTIPTCISREGQGFINMKYIPMPYKSQLQGKLISGLLISLLATLPVVWIVSIFAIIALGVHPLILFVVTFLCVVTLLFVSYIQLLFDLIHPKLIWDNEAVAVKQNFVAALSMMVIMILGGLIGGLGFLLYSPFSNLWAAVMAIILLLIGCCLFLRVFVYKYGERKLEDLE